MSISYPACLHRVDAREQWVEPCSHCLAEKVDRIHAWLEELMPTLRTGAAMLDKRNRLLGMVTGAKRTR